MAFVLIAVAAVASSTVGSHRVAGASNPAVRPAPVARVQIGSHASSLIQHDCRPVRQVVAC